MKLFRFELRKLLLNKKTLIILAVMFALYIGIGVANIIMPFKGTGTHEIYTELAGDFTGKLDLVQAEKSTAEVSELQGLYGTGHMVERMSSTNGQLKFDYQYSAFATRVNTYYNGTGVPGSDEIIGIKPLEEEIARLEAAGETDTYQYDKLVKQLDFEKNIGEPEFQEVTSWDSLFEEWGGIFILILLFFPLAFLIAPVFTMEASTGMDNVILSSQNGRGKLVVAKLGAVAVTCTVVTLIFFLGTALGNFIPFLSLYGGGNSIRCISSLLTAQLDVSIFSFSMITVFWVLFVAIVFGFIVSLISSKMKNHAAVFGFGIIVLMVNMVIEALGTEIVEFLDVVVKLGFTNTVSSISIFGGTTTFNIFGLVVPYYAVALFGLTCFAVLSVIGVYHSQKKRTIA